MATRRRRPRLPESPWVPIYAFIGFVIFLFAIALFGYFSGRWEASP